MVVIRLLMLLFSLYKVYSESTHHENDSHDFRFLDIELLDIGRQFRISTFLYQLSQSINNKLTFFKFLSNLLLTIKLLRSILTQILLAIINRGGSKKSRFSHLDI